MILCHSSMYIYIYMWDTSISKTWFQFAKDLVAIDSLYVYSIIRVCVCVASSGATASTSPGFFSVTVSFDQLHSWQFARLPEHLRGTGINKIILPGASFVQKVLNFWYDERKCPANSHKSSRVFQTCHLDQTFSFRSKLL